MSSQKNCLSLYIYYKTQEEFLSILLIIDKISAYKEISSYFFIRYIEIEKQIRLRLFIKESKQKKIILRQLEELFSRFKLKIVPYKREMLRYGGAKGILIAEENFYISSQLALEYFLKSPGNYLQTFVLALTLIVSFPTSLDMTSSDKNCYFTFLFDHYFTNKQSLIPLFEKRLKKEDKKLLKYLKKIINCNTSHEYPLNIQAWIYKMKQIGKKLHNLIDEEGMRIQSCPYIAKKKLYDSKYLIWHVLDSYNHMNNNRLGISPYDEGYLYFLTFKLYSIF